MPRRTAPSLWPPIAYTYLVSKTIVIGDIHGDREQLDRLLGRLPAIGAHDTLVFLGDYLDRGPDSRGVIERVREVDARIAEQGGRCITLRGNHEQAWLESLDDPNPGFLLPQGNGCRPTVQSFARGEELGDDDLILRLLKPRTWFPPEIETWMRGLPHWYENEHAIYVHAGLEGEDHEWFHPSQSHLKNLLWCREPDFFANYAGKRLVFGHTQVKDLPKQHAGLIERVLHRHDTIWMRGDLIGIDTGCGKGGFLSAIELPSMIVFDSRE